jgi:RNA polymerase sigma factor (sigma-70 family)
MGDANRALRATLVNSYEYLVDHLERRLRSPELARDALHDAYLRLERSKEIEKIGNPIGLLLRVATNLARDRERKSRRLLTLAEIETAFNLVDDAPDPARTAEAISEFQAFERALAELPARRRAILLASLKERLPSRVISQRFGLSKRRVDVELKLAREHCARVLLKKTS